MKRLYQQYRGDDEVAVLYALSLLGTARPGESNLRHAMQAAAIAQDVFQRNPKHPGAPHFVIHAFDDPDYAALALPAARAYAKIAPAPRTRCTCPRTSSCSSGCGTTSSTRTSWPTRPPWISAERKNLPRGREDFHTLSWLQYAYLQLGKVADALSRRSRPHKRWRPPTGAPGVANGYASMKARQVVESGNWERLPLAAASAAGAAPGYDGNAGVRVRRRVRGGEARRPRRGRPRARPAALTAGRGRGRLERVPREADRDHGEGGGRRAGRRRAGAAGLGAEQLLKEAIAIELTLDAPSGPPEPIKPSFELYGELLLAQGRLEGGRRAVRAVAAADAEPPRRCAGAPAGEPAAQHRRRSVEVATAGNPSAWRPRQNSSCPPILNSRPCSTPVGRRNSLLAVVEKSVLIALTKSLLNTL